MPNNIQMLKRRADSLSSQTDTRSKDSSHTYTSSHNSDILLFVQGWDAETSTTSTATALLTAESSSFTTTDSPVPSSTQTVSDMIQLSAIIQSLADFSSDNKNNNVIESFSPIFYISDPLQDAMVSTISDINSVFAVVSKEHMYSSWRSSSISISSDNESYSVSVVTTLSYPFEDGDDDDSSSSLFYNGTQPVVFSNSTVALFNNSDDISTQFSNDTQFNSPSVQTVTVHNVRTFTEGVVITTTLVHGSSTLRITSTLPAPQMTAVAFVYTQPYDVIVDSAKSSSFEFGWPTTVTTHVPVGYELSGLSVGDFHTMTVDYDYYKQHFPNVKESTSSGKKGGVIAGSVIGSIVGVSVLVFLLYFISKKMKQRDSSASDNSKEKKSSEVGDKDHDEGFVSTILNSISSLFKGSIHSSSSSPATSKDKKVKLNADIFDDGYNYGQYDDLLSNRSGGASSIVTSSASSTSSASVSTDSSSFNHDDSLETSTRNGTNNVIATSSAGTHHHHHHHHRHHRQHNNTSFPQNMRRKSGESNSSCDSAGSGGLFSMRDSILQNSGSVAAATASPELSPYVVCVEDNSSSERDQNLFKRQYSMNGNYKIAEEDEDEVGNQGPQDVARPSPTARVVQKKTNTNSKNSNNRNSSIYNGGGFLAGGRRRVIDTVYEESIASSRASSVSNDDAASHRSSASGSIKISGGRNKKSDGIKKSKIKNDKSYAIGRGYNHHSNNVRVKNGAESAAAPSTSVNANGNKNSGRRYSSSGLLKYYNNANSQRVHEEEEGEEEYEEENDRRYNSENNFGYVENDDDGDEEDVEKIKNPFEEALSDDDDDGEGWP